MKDMILLEILKKFKPAKRKFKAGSLVLLFLLAVLMELGSTMNAAASFGFDMFKGTRTYVTPLPANLAGNYGVTTNFLCDLSKFTGKINVDIWCITNTANAGGTCTVAFWGSNTNASTLQPNPLLTSVTNYAFVNSPTFETITNFYYGSTNLIATNTILYPGTVTTITPGNAWQNLFLGQYLADSGTSYFTNTGAATISGAPTSLTHFSISAQDAPRYLWFCLQPGGTVTNFTVAIQVTGANNVGP